MSVETLRASAAKDTPRILIVDDVPMFLELESMFLSQQGEVTNARTGAQALESMAAQPADVAVVDFHLPDTTGDVLCGELRRVAGDPNLPVVLVSNGSSAEHALAVRAGATDVIQKPLSQRELVGAVSRMLVPGGPRGLPRIPVDAPAVLHTPDHPVQGRVRNLSRGGVFIESDWFPPTGTEMGLEFSLPEEPETVAATATTVWRQLRADRGPTGIGLRFLELEGASMRALDGYVHERYQPGSSQAWTGAPD